MAIGEYNKAIQRDGDNANAYINRGYSYHELGQYQNAVNDYTKAIQIGGHQDALAYNNRGIGYRKLGQYALANTDKTKACSLDSQFC